MKIVRYLVRLLVYQVFLKEPKLVLRLLRALRLDLHLFSLPYFLLANLASLRRLRRLKRRGLSPAIVYWAVEDDGRFERTAQLAADPGYVQAVFFRFPKEVVAVESLIFASYARRKCGFYEDARMNYVQPDNRENRESYRAYVRRLFDLLERWTGPIDLFLSGSNHDRYVVEMVAVAQERGTAWVVAEREGTGTIYTYENEAKCLKSSGCVTADYLFMANEGHKHMFQYSRQPSVKQVSVIGELDTDFWFHWPRAFTRRAYRAWDHYEKKVVFLTFGTRNYIESYAFPNNPEMNWCNLLEESEEEVLAFAQRNRNVLVFYKMGHVEDNNPVFIKKCEAAGLTNVVPLYRAFPCHELMCYSDLVIGFQTTAMFEAMFLDIPLFYLYWSIPECVDRKTQMLPLADSGACTVVESRQRFAELLDRFAAGDPAVTTISETEKRNRKATRELMFANADGRMAERFFDQLNQIIGERRAGRVAGPRGQSASIAAGRGSQPAGV